MSDAHDPLKAFLAQPSEHDVGDDDEVLTAPAPHRGVGQWIRHFLFEKKPNDYSSIAPRKSDGSRTRLFFFNGSGRGR